MSVWALIETVDRETSSPDSLTYLISLIKTVESPRGLIFRVLICIKFASSSCTVIVDVQL